MTYFMGRKKMEKYNKLSTTEGVSFNFIVRF